MLYRLLVPAFALLFAFACNSSSNVSEQTEDNVEAGQQNMAATIDGDNDNNQALSGDNYVITIVDGKIKSPRKELKGTIDGVEVTINYGSPSVNGRTIYGDLVPYQKVWRTGANEATRITFNQDVEVGEEDAMLPAGTYSLFTLPNSADDWTIIFNKTADQWGAYDYDEAQDAVRVSAESATLPQMAEQMDFALTDEEVTLMWADRKVMFEVEPAE